MKYRNIPGTDLDVSEISFGCMSLKQGNDVENIALLYKAVDSGINLFDTADLYDHGENEEVVGKALKAHRDKVYIATKVGNRWREDRSGWDWVPKKEYILEAVEHSLKRLQTDYIDLYQLHGGTIQDNFDEVFETFEILKEQGKIRYYGISSIRPNVIREVIPKRALSSVMVQYSLLDRRPEEFILPYLAEHNRGVLVRGSLAKGLLINKAPKAYLDYSEEEVLKLQVEMNNSGNPVAKALSYVLSNKTISTSVIGFRNSHQLDEVLKAYDLLGEHVSTDFHQAFPASIYTAHR